MEVLPLFLPLVLGYILDLLFGDPRWLPHPIVLFGKMIASAERRLNRGEHRLLKGALVAILFPLLVFAIFVAILYGAFLLNIYLYYILATLTVFFGLASRSLVDEGREVITTLERDGLEVGRKRLSWIVGRDTNELSAKEIYTAVLETMAENLSDGAVAPILFYLLGAVVGGLVSLLGGFAICGDASVEISLSDGFSAEAVAGGVDPLQSVLPIYVALSAACGGAAMMMYKMVNTLDSMVGYKDPRYKDFGCFSAKLDDIFNYIPARLTSLVMALLFYRRGLFSFIRRYSRAHASPNSGFPESALAGILNCRFGGTHTYHGMVVEKHYIGDNDRDLTLADFRTAAVVNSSVTLFFILLVSLCFILFPH